MSVEGFATAMCKFNTLSSLLAKGQERLAAMRRAAALAARPP
jgi:hypothetical protein